MLLRQQYTKIIALIILSYLVCYLVYLQFVDTCPESILYIKDLPETPGKFEPEYLSRVKILTNCNDKRLDYKIERRNNFWVLYNYIVADQSFKCHESITFTTHGDYTFLDNLIQVTEKWRGPISMALYTPGSDYEITLNSIAYLRECTTPLIKELVTFHIYFDDEHMPSKILSVKEATELKIDCKTKPPYISNNSTPIFKTQNKLLYPINVGRNVARETAQTHYIFPCDVELYPSNDIIPKFLKMISRNKGPSANKKRKVFPLHLFEIYKDQVMPETKTKLLQMLKNKTAIPFHAKICSSCHKIPYAKQWQSAKENDEINVFYTGKRHGQFSHWEPIYIGTNAEPLYDERLSWDGQSDKMTQGYLLCLLDYEFQILDNAFLVHRPGVKLHVYRSRERNAIIIKTNTFLKSIVQNEINILYGTNSKCML